MWYHTESTCGLIDSMMDFQIIWIKYGQEMKVKHLSNNTSTSNKHMTYSVSYIFFYFFLTQMGWAFDRLPKIVDSWNRVNVYKKKHNSQFSPPYQTWGYFRQPTYQIPLNFFKYFNICPMHTRIIFHHHLTICPTPNIILFKKVSTKE
jgi:hypothetical protein